MPAGSPAPSTTTTSDSSSNQHRPLSPHAYSRHPGRRISPTQAKERPVSQYIASTLSSLHKHASTSFASGLTSLSAVTRSPTTSVDDGHDTADTEVVAATHDDVLIDQLAGLDDRLSSSEVIAWTSWDRWRGSARPALIVAYVTGGLQVYTLESDGQLVEIINFQQILLPGDRVAGRVLCARIQCLDGKQPRLLVVTEGHDASYILAVCSLDSPIVDECLSLPHVKDATTGVAAAAPMAASIQLSHRYLVIGQSHPPALHILDATTLRSRETIFDAAAGAAGGPPPSHLSGRLLAYASTQPERHSNIIFAPDQDTRIETAEQARAAAIEMGTHAGGVARKLGGGLVNGVNNVREWSAQRGGAQAAVSPHSPAPPQKTSSHAAASIRVLDLSSSTSSPLVASWAAEDTAAVKLSSSGSLVFVADSLGHAFNVYEIRPRPACMRSGSSSSPPVWHRFKLLRGVTPAQVIDVLWSANERCIGVLTSRGPTHVYRLGPLHGPRAKPYGSTLTSFARTAAPAGEQASQNEPAAATPSPSSASPPVATLAAHVGISAATGPSLLDVLTFHPRFAILALSRIAPREAAGPSTSSSAMSGLTAMIARARTTTQCRTVAVWTGLARVHDAPEVRPPGSATTTTTTTKLSPPTNRRRRSTPARGWVSMAEVHTSDHRQRQMTPLYLSHQMHFRAFDHPIDATLRSEPTLMDISRAVTTARDVRETVRITSPDLAGSSSKRSMQSAMSLAAASSSLPRSPSSPCIPSFPQGQPALGRRRSTKGVAIAAAGMSIPVRLGAAKLGAAAAAAHRRLSSPPVAAAQPSAPALPFDDDVSYDAYLFADARHAQPSPNGGRGGGVGPTATAMSSLEEDGEDDVAGTFSSSADTPPTNASDHDDFERDDDGGEWVAARGMQEDVKGDECGWDSFADAEFGIAAAPSAAAAGGVGGVGGTKGGAQRDDFLVGHLTLDDEMKPGGADSAMPSFSRKASATATSPSPVVGSLSGGGGGAAGNNSNASAALAASSKLKPTSSAIGKASRQKEDTPSARTAPSSVPKSTATTTTSSSSTDSSSSSPSQQALNTTTTKAGFRVQSRVSPAASSSSPFKSTTLSLPGSLPTSTTTASSSPSSLSSTSSLAGGAKRR